jgi:hypothetical protein
VKIATLEGVARAARNAAAHPRSDAPASLAARSGDSSPPYAAPVNWRRVAAATAVLVATTAAPQARAHSGDPNVHARIDAVTPPLPGVTIVVRSGVADELLVVNTTPTPVEVLDANGVPFLRIAQHDVEANFASKDWYLSNSPLGLAQPPRATTATWRTVSRTGSWGWFDHRLHDRARPLTPELRAARTTVRLADWTVPLRYGGRDVTVKGHVEYRPVLGAFRTTVDRTPPGADVDVLDGRVPGVFLRWHGDATLTVAGIGAEPFARLTSNSAEVNAASETWQDDQRLRGQAVTTPADPHTPRWQRQARQPQLTWLDRRLAYAPGAPPDDVARSAKPTTLVEWTIPVTVGTTHDAITGTTTWQPATSDKPRSLVPYAAAALLATAVAATAIRRRAARR